MLLSQKEFSHDAKIDKNFEEMNNEGHNIKDSKKDKKNCILSIKEEINKEKKLILMITDLNT